jgi:methionine salvage enolase-phosphatase E1
MGTNSSITMVSDTLLPFPPAFQKLQNFQARREKREQELTQVESLTNGPDEEQERKQELMDQLIEEANEAANTKRTLEGELKSAQAPVKVNQRELNQIEKEQGHAA